MELEILIENLKSILKEESKSHEIWLFGSYTKQDSYNDIDLGVVIHDEISQSLIPKIKSISTQLLLEPARCYGSSNTVDYRFHVVLFSKNDFYKLPIGTSTRNGDLVYKIVA